MQLLKMIPFTRWPETASSHSKQSSPLTIDVNQANTEDWQKLKGIGPVLSKRIVKFRNALGGFYTIDQIGQTFGLPDSTFQAIKPYLKLISPFSKISINSISEAILKKHPYISWKQAQVLVRFRNERNQLTDIEDLKAAEIFDSTEIRRLQPYIDFSVHTQELSDSAEVGGSMSLHPDSLR